MNELNTAPPSTVWIVSDLHLDVSPDDTARDRSDAFARFILKVLAEQYSPESDSDQLVILGDFMDLPNTTLSAAREVVDEIARAHESVFAALTRLVSAGMDLVVVPGNHDVELTMEKVFSTLRRHIVPTSEAHGRVRLVPWIYYVPDRIYAEHGNQYHDINWFSTLLRPTYRHDGERLQRTSARWLGHLPALGETRRGGLRLVLTSLAGLAKSLQRSPAWAMSREEYLASVAVPYGVSIGIGADAARALDAVTSRGPMTVVRRVARKMIRQLWSRLRRWDGFSASEWRDRYLRDAVPEIVAVTRSHSIGVPFYVFGHTHVAACSTVDGEALYLNAGTWSGQLPADRVPAPECWLTFLRITYASADLMRWDDTLQDWNAVEVYGTYP